MNSSFLSRKLFGFCNFYGTLNLSHFQLTLEATTNFIKVCTIFLYCKQNKSYSWRINVLVIVVLRLNNHECHYSTIRSKMSSCNGIKGFQHVTINRFN